MPQSRTHEARLPPALNIVALAIFAANLSARGLDPVLPQVAGEFGVSIAFETKSMLVARVQRDAGSIGARRKLPAVF